jgi:hypothetical protein
MARKRQGTENRHLGRRVELYMPDSEYTDMLEVMSAMRIDNKSDFIRSSIKSYCEYQTAKKEVRRNA